MSYDRNTLYLLVRASLNAYMYGSKVYGVATADSDDDYILVMPDICNYAVSALQEIEEGFAKSDSRINVKLFTETEWQELLNNQYISAIECQFLPAEKIIKKTKDFGYSVELHQLRASLSERTSISFVKAKKKLADGEFRTGKKSLWHSLRILMFGMQIATFGKIIDYTCANMFYDDIVMNPCNEWKQYKQKYYPIYTALKTEFRKVAPKGV